MLGWLAGCQRVVAVADVELRTATGAAAASAPRHRHPSAPASHSHHSTASPAAGGPGAADVARPSSHSDRPAGSRTSRDPRVGHHDANRSDPRASHNDANRSDASKRGGGSSGDDLRGGAFRRFREQTYDVYRPMPTLRGALLVLSALFAVGLGLGVPLLVAALGVVEVRVRYDDALAEAGSNGMNASSSSSSSSGSAELGSRDLQQRALWSVGDLGVHHSLTVTVPRVMRPPVYVLYELSGFFGTHKRYVRSVSRSQLAGQQLGADQLDVCRPRLFVDGGPNASRPAGGLVNPCGLRAASLFNDTITLSADPSICALSSTTTTTDSTTPSLSGSAPAAQPQPQPAAPASNVSASGGRIGGRRSGRRLREKGGPGRPPEPDLRLNFAPVLGLDLDPGRRRIHQQKQGQQQIAPAGADQGGGARIGDDTGEVFEQLPLDEQGIEWALESRLLYGMYNASNLNTVPPRRHGGEVQGPVGRDRHLQVWMRPSARPETLKLYGILHTELPPGCVLRLDVANRYNTYAWGGSKRVVLTNQSWYGMRNFVLPAVLLAVAGMALGGIVVLLVLGLCLPRADVLKRRDGGN